MAAELFVVGFRITEAVRVVGVVVVTEAHVGPRERPIRFGNDKVDRTSPGTTDAVAERTNSPSISRPHGVALEGGTAAPARCILRQVSVRRRCVLKRKNNNNNNDC